MNWFTQHKVPWLIAGLLLVMNAAILTYFMMPSPPVNLEGLTKQERDERLVQFFQKSLDLDPPQEDSFRVVLLRFHETFRLERQQIDKIRIHMLSEMVSPTRSDSTMEQILQNLTDLGKEHEMSLMNCYDRLAGICSPNQIPALREEFTNMVNNGPKGDGPGRPPRPRGGDRPNQDGRAGPPPPR
ncbi:MAG: hypothetical protein NWR72_03075 [Bacteroidia bacterium]|nr:hypothetical protein [Bacteroidia bacterium]